MKLGLCPHGILYPHTAARSCPSCELEALRRERDDARAERDGVIGEAAALMREVYVLREWAEALRDEPNDDPDIGNGAARVLRMADKAREG